MYTFIVCIYIYVYIYIHICMLQSTHLKYHPSSIIFHHGLTPGSAGVALARFLNDVWRSDDGLLWRRVVPVGPVWAPRAAAAAATVGSTVVVAGGRGEEGPLEGKRGRLNHQYYQPIVYT